MAHHFPPAAHAGAGRPFVRLLFPMLLLVSVVVPSLPACAAAREVPNLSLLDLGGRDHELYQAPGRVVVLFFTGTGCPIARKSAGKLRELERRFGAQGVSCWIVNSYPGDSTADAARESEELGLRRLTYLRDPKQTVALALGVERTAEVVAIDLQTRRVFYQGAIDDQFAEGSERPAAREHFLRQALSEHLEGRPVTTAVRSSTLMFSIAAKTLSSSSGPQSQL